MQQRDQEICVLVAMLRERDDGANGHPPALPVRITEAHTAGMCSGCHASVLPSCVGLTVAAPQQALPRCSARARVLRRRRRTRRCFAPSTAKQRRSARRSVWCTVTPVSCMHGISARSGVSGGDAGAGQRKQAAHHGAQDRHRAGARATGAGGPGWRPVWGGRGRMQRRRGSC